MGVFLYIPWFKLEPWPVETPILVGIVLLGCALAAIANAEWRQQAGTTALLAVGVGVAVYMKGFEEIPIQPFGVLVATGVLAGSRLAEWYAKKQGIEPAYLADYITHVVVIGFLGAYLLNGVFYETEKLLSFFEDPSKIFSEWLGLSSYGGFIGAIFGSWVWSKRRGFPAMPLADCMAFGFPLGWVFGRMGCFVVHDHPGAQTDFFLAVDNYHQQGVPRHDMGFYEVLVALAIVGLWFFILKRMPQQKRPMGLWCALMPMIYAPIRFGLDYFRATDVAGADVRAAGLTPAQYASIGMFIMSLALLAWVRKHPEWVIPKRLALGAGEDADDSKPEKPEKPEETEKAEKDEAKGGKSSTRRKRKKKR